MGARARRARDGGGRIGPARVCARSVGRLPWLLRQWSWAANAQLRNRLAAHERHLTPNRCWRTSPGGTAEGRKCACCRAAASPAARRRCRRSAAGAAVACCTAAASSGSSSSAYVREVTKNPKFESSRVGGMAPRAAKNERCSKRCGAKITVSSRSCVTARAALASCGRCARLARSPRRVHARRAYLCNVHAPAGR